MRSLRYLREIESLDPERDAQRIYYLMVGFEFSWEITRALELALLRTFCSPKVSNLLDRTRQFERLAQRRYDDTSIMLQEIIQWGVDHKRGDAFLRRMNAIHGQYAIANDEFLYVLSTFIYVPIRFLEAYGWRPLSAHERLATYHFWRGVGEGMGIEDIPASYDAFDAWRDEYEQSHFQISETNRKIAETTIQLYASWFPQVLAPLVRQGAYALMDDCMREAFGYPEAHPVVACVVRGGLRLRARARRYLPAKQVASFDSGSTYRSYPKGYTLEELGPPTMIDSLNGEQ